MADKGQVNLTGVKQSKGVWLVKVPKYLSEQWDKAPEKGEVGKITIGKKLGKTEVSFSLNEELTARSGVGENDASTQVPREHPFTMHTAGGQTMAVFSQGNGDEIRLEGMVVHRAECRPVVNDDYMRLKKLVPGKPITALGTATHTAGFCADVPGRCRAVVCRGHTEPGCSLKSPRNLSVCRSSWREPSRPSSSPWPTTISIWSTTRRRRPTGRWCERRSRSCWTCSSLPLRSTSITTLRTWWTSPNNLLPT
uniref:General transcription factor IIF subunit 2 n=1 Tax=Gasterosteus aculeatus aculeatus TaxID=481459 RepID=A0AAQ4RJ62_GASAC